MSEQVVLVDPQDNQLGLEEKLRAHELGLLHRAFSVFVFDQRGRLLLQQREQSKYHCGGLWTNTCCSHPRAGEKVQDAAKRRMLEEMGFTCDVQQVGSFIYRAQFANGLIEHELDHVFIGKYTGQDINPNPTEVQAYKWVTVSDLIASLLLKPREYTPWLNLALQVVTTKCPEGIVNV